ncbi:MAG: UvrD-helicase domain-containing protein, partial [Acidobacteriota bacterium]
MRLGDLPDFQMRKEAIMTSDHAFVWASAGTGKTHTLALRALYLLLNAPFLSHGNGEREGFIGPDCALYSAASRSERLKAARVTIRSLVLPTFTRKAAAEMQTRVYRYLDSIAAAPSLADLEAKYLDSGKGLQDPLFCEIVQSVLRNLTAEVSRHDLPLLKGLEFGESYQRLRAGAQALGELATELQISTIHSLAASILRRYPLQAGIPPAAHFAREDEDDLAGVEDQVVERWWQRVVLDDSEAQEELVNLLEVVPVSQIRHWLKLSYQFPWIGEEAETLPLNDKEQIDQLVEAVQALVQALGTAAGARIERERTRLAQIGRRMALDEAGGWEQLCLFARELRQYLFLDRAKSKGIRDAIKGLPPRHAQYFQSWIHLYSPAARVCVAKQFGKTWKLWTRFLGRFISWADGAGIREIGLITFDEMIRLAVRLLEENPG